MSIPAITTENVEKALHQLYCDPSTESKDAAQLWLTKAQRSAEAWQFAWTLLEETKPTEVQYFGASALISKIAGSWNDIPSSEVMVLRNRLLEQIVKFSIAKEKRIVLTRLCVAFANFLANCAIKQLWPTAIRDIIHKFHEPDKNTVVNEHKCFALLEILTIVPEEFQTSRMEKYKKGLFFHLLKSGQVEVLELLVEVFQSSSLKAAQGRVIKCLSSWIILGVALTDCEKLLCNVFECVKDNELFDDCVDCLLNTFCSPAAQDYPNTVKKFIPLLLHLQPLFQKAVNEHDADTILGLTKVICGMAENFPKLVIASYQDPQYGLGVLSMVLDCCRIPLQYPTEEFSSPLSFTFWCSLQDEIEALSASERVKVYQYLHPYFFELVNSLLVKACYPKDNSYDVWNAEEKEMHRIYRVDVSDTLMYVLEMLGINLFLHIFARLQTSIQEAASDKDRQWHEIEACLFALHCVVESLAEFDSEIPCLQTLTEILPTIHVSSLQLADTMLYTIGTLTEWLSLQSGNLVPLVLFVLKCLSNHELALSAVLTMRRLVRECCDDLIPFAGDIMQHFTDLLIGGSLQRNVEVWLMQAAGHMLSVIQRDECLKYIEKLLQLHLHQLEALSKDAASAPSKTSVLHILDLLANLFATLDRRQATEDGRMVKTENEEQPAILILNQLSPIVQSLLSTWVTDKEIVDAVCQMYDKSIRSLVEDFAPVLLQLSELICVVFQHYPYPCLMTLSQQLLLVFGNEEAHFTVVSKLFHALVATVLPLYHSGNIKSHPDIAQEFMRFVDHACKKCFVLLQVELNKCSQSIFTDLFKCAIMTLQLPEGESVSSSSSFICDFVALYSDHTEVAAAIDSSLNELFVTILQAIGGASPRTNMDKFADILSSIARVNFSLFSKCLEETMSLPDVPCTSVNMQEKAVFLKQLLREIKRKQKFREIVREFTLVCRGLHGTDYAAS